MAEPIIVDLPDGTEAEFPAGTPLTTIQAAVQKRFPPAGQAEPEVTWRNMPSVEGAIEVPPGKKEMAGGIRTVMETGGALGGGALGSFLGPAGAIGGETLGYAGASKGADLFLGEETGGWPQKLAEGAAFSVIPRGLLFGAEKLGRGAVRSALKIPPTQAKGKVADQVVDTVIKENLRVGEGGIAKAKGVIRSIEDKMDNLLTKSGSEIDVNEFGKAIDSIKSKFKYSSNPQAQYSVLDAVKQEALNHPSVVNGKLPIAEAQKLKKGLYQELKGFYSNLQGLAPKQAMASNAESVGKATWAESIRKNIMSDPSIPPEATDWLKREANVVNALRWIERRANVAANMDPITFNDVLLGGLIREGVPYAVAARVLRMPSVLSQVGIWATKSKAAQKPIQAGAIATKGYLSQ